jgi:HAE1 family hydrophobic/amphiphilic exporter-1
LEALARLAARRPVAMNMFALVIMVLGYFSWKELPLDLFPDLQSPTIVISITSGDRPPVEMERLYGERVEQQLFTVQGLREIEQVARSGRLITRVTFNWDANIDLALIDVNKAVAPIASDTNVDDVQVRRFDPRQAPVLVLGLTAPNGAPELAELRRLARRQLAPTLEQMEGVAEVRVTGGRIKEAQVKLDRPRMDAYNLTLTQIEQRINATNVDINAGTIVEDDNVLVVRGISRFTEIENIQDVVISYVDDGNGGTVPVTVADIGEVVMADADITNMVRVNGVEGVGVSIYKEAGANTVAVSEDVREALGPLIEDLPGIEYQIVSDEAGVVEQAINEVEDAAVWGMLLSILVLVVYLRSAGPVVVVAVAIPVSLLATVFAMRIFGQSLNLMTLGGIALGAGMLVDNAIVVVESIFRFRDDGHSPHEAAAKGTGYVASAIIASTLTNCVVFLPILFIQGMAARMVSGMAFTVIMSLLASLVVAILLVPALSVWLLPKKKSKAIDPGSSGVEKMVLRLLQMPGTIITGSFIVNAIATWFLLGLGSELIAPSDPSQFDVRVVASAGQRVEATAETVATIEGVIGAAAGADLEAVMSEVGRLEDDNRVIREEQTEEHTAEMHVRLASGGLSANALVQRAVPHVEAMYGVEVTWEVGDSTLAQALGTGGPPIVVEISGTSLEDLRTATDTVQQQLAASPVLWNVQTSFEGAPPELRLTLNHARADALGVDLNAVGKVIEASLDGLKTGTLTLGDEEREVQVSLPQVSTQQLLELPFRTDKGLRITVGDVVTISEEEGAREIFRRDQRRVAQVTANILAPATTPEAKASVEEILAGIDLVPGLTMGLAGEELERQEVFNELFWAAILAGLLVFMVLAATFESLLHPFTVIATIPMSMVGIAAFLVPVGQPIGVMAMLGFIVLVGVAVNDSILFTEYARRLIDEGLELKTALAKAAALRYRPIMMTTWTAALGLLPMAFAQGEAAAMRAPLAMTMIGGLIASTAAAITVIPCIYYVLERLRRRGGVKVPDIAPARG